MNPITHAASGRPPAPKTHRSKAGFHNASLYSAHLPEQSYARIPGYKGHVPGVRVEGIGIGTTVGRATHGSMALGSTTQSMTGSPSNRAKYYTRELQDATLKAKEATHTWGHSPASDRNRVNHRPGSKVSAHEAIYKNDMPPGYGGFIPKARGITGSRQAVAIKMGLATHDRAQEARTMEREHMAAVRYSKPTLRRRPDYVISTEKEYVSQTMMMKPNTTAYDPDYGVMKGTTKFMPQRAWNSVGHNNGNWSRQTADLVGHMSSPPAKKTNTPAFQPKPKGHRWNTPGSSYIGAPGTTPSSRPW